MSALERFRGRYTKCRGPRGKCWEWIGATISSGYGEFYINGIQTTAHRASYIMHVGPVPVGIKVCHTCDFKLCVNPKHLFLGTDKQNMQDAASKGRLIRKLSKIDVSSIKFSTLSNKSLARRYGCSDVMVGLIKRGLARKQG